MSRALQVLLESSNLKGRKKVFVSNRDMQCEFIPMQEVSSYKEDKVSIYILMGTDENTSEELIYVGETEEISTRLKHHFKTKSFWDNAYAFYSSNDQLTKADVKYLEAVIHNKIHAAGRYRLQNESKPKQSHVTEIRAYELADMLQTIEFILAGAFSLYPFERLSVVDALAIKEKEVLEEQHELQKRLKDIHYLTEKGANAKGYLLGEGKKFVVLKGSRTVLIEKKAKHFPMSKVEKLGSLGVVKQVKDCYEFVTDYVFNSPSGASDVIYFGSTNGWQMWKSESGETLEQKRTLV